MTLTEFLLVRIAEDEDRANHANWAMQGTWYADDAQDKVDEFVHRLSPTRVLAECEAKRRIVELVRPDPSHLVGAEAGAMPELVLRLLAWIYADHPDYDETWRP